MNLQFKDTKIFTLANAITKEAIQHANLDFNTLNRDRIGILLGNQFGAMSNYMHPDKLRLLKTMNHMVSALLAINHQLYGYTSAASTGSSSGAVAIGEAYRLIKHGYQDIMIAGGVDLNLNRHFFEGMELFGANCSKFNDEPDKASRPYDVTRAGPVMSDGGAAMVVESLESALKRKANIICEIGGYSMNTDAFHILRPTDNGIGLYKAIRESLLEA